MNEELTNENDELESDEPEVQEAEASEDETGSETPSTKSSGKSGDDQDWGFEPKKKKLTKEVLLGFLAIAILVGVFGVVVMDKISGDDDKFVEATKLKKGDDKKKKDPFDDSKEDSNNVVKNDDDENSIFNQGEPGNDQDNSIEDNQAQQNQELINRQNVFGANNNLNDDSLVNLNRDDLDSNVQTSSLFERTIESENDVQFDPSNNLTDRNELADSTPQLRSLDGNPLDNQIAINDGSLDINQGSPFADRAPLGPTDGNIRLDDRRPIDTRDQQLNSLIDPENSIADNPIGPNEPRGIFNEPLGSPNNDNSLVQFDQPLNNRNPTQLIDPNALDAARQSNLGNTEIADNPFDTEDAGPMTFEPPKNQGELADFNALEERPGDITTPGLDNNIFENSNARDNGAPFNQPAIANTVASAAAGTYVIQDGDSYWNISKKVYGTPKHFQALADYNKHLVKNANRLKPKTSILTPTLATLTGKPEAIAVARAETPIGGDTTLTSSTRIVSNSEVGTTVRKPQIPQQGIFFNAQGHPMYRVGEKDTLTTIAAEHLGRWSRWRQIYRMNQDQLPDPNKLALKIILRLPADASTTPLVSKDREIR